MAIKSAAKAAKAASNAARTKLMRKLADRNMPFANELTNNAPAKIIPIITNNDLIEKYYANNKDFGF